MQKIILDTDIGSEMTDAATLCMVARAPELDLLAVTTVTHDAHFRASTAALFLELLGKKVPIAAGERSAEEHSWEKSVLFPNGYTPAHLDERSASQLIVDTINQFPGEVAILGIGTLTNIAGALDLNPELPSKTKELLLMGGMIKPPIVGGKQIPIGFEYNFCNDNVAATKVISAGFNLTILPGDVTFQEADPWTDDDVAYIAGLAHPAAKLLSQLQNRSIAEAKQGLEYAGLPLEFAQHWVNDELLPTYLLRPDLYQTLNTHIQWRLEGKYPMITLADAGFPVRIITQVDFAEARKFILNRLETL